MSDKTQDEWNEATEEYRNKCESQKILGRENGAGAKAVCPNCGYCPHCGRTWSSCYRPQPAGYPGTSLTNLSGQWTQTGGGTK